MDDFWSKVEKTDSCWWWVAGKTGAGYGALYVDGKQVLAHRHSYALRFGPIPKGKIIRHACDHPDCVNPAHLIVGTQRDNIHDAIDRGRHAPHGKNWTHCKSGHEFTPENTYIKSDGHRACRACGRRWTAEHRQRKG